MSLQDTRGDDAGSLDDYGAGSEHFGGIDGVWTGVSLGEVFDEESSISVSGHWMDDEPPGVELRLGQDAAGITAGLSTDEARQLGERLIAAAERAEAGNTELNGERR